jgi:hypothetical protein
MRVYTWLCSAGTARHTYFVCTSLTGIFHHLTSARHGQLTRALFLSFSVILDLSDYTHIGVDCPAHSVAQYLHRPQWLPQA